MMLPIEKIGKVLAAFIDKQVLPNAEGPWQIASTVFVATALVRRGDNLPEPVRNTLAMLGVMKDEKIDVEFTYELAKEALNRVGIVKIFGVEFDRDDLDALYNIAKSHSKEVGDDD